MYSILVSGNPYLYPMIKRLLAVVFILPVFSVAQPIYGDDAATAIPQEVDSLYREDQFYVGLSFNLLTNHPKDFNQNGFSGGIHAGFIRDMPINKRRNKAFGIGLGVSANTYNTNQFIGETQNGISQFEILDPTAAVNTNRFNTTLVELPVQYRWRTSTATNFNFWRVYTGFKLGYIFRHKAVFESPDQSLTRTNVAELDRWRYILTLSVGNGSFNAFVQYHLNPLFAPVNEQVINVPDFHPLKFGIEFYIL